MTTEQIQYLQAIFREGSLNRAAKSLGLSQSTMSKSLQSLERELGVSLFLRVQGRLMPTRQGYVVLDMVQKISGLQEQMVKCLNIFRSERGDSITMGFPFYWNYASFAPVLENFHRLYCYPAFYLVLNHATFKQIKKRHNINYSDGFYIGLLYAVPLVLS